MKIAKVGISGIKGMNSSVSLTGKDLFIGQNGSGKTVIKDVIQFVLTGKIGNKSKLVDIFEYYGNGNMLSGTVEFDNVEVGRSITKKEKNGTSYSESAWVKVDGIDFVTGKTAVKEYLDQYSILNLAFDFDTFVQKNASDRKADIDSILPIRNANPDELNALLKPILNNQHKSISTELSIADLNKLINSFKTEESVSKKMKEKYRGGASTIADFKNDISGNTNLLDTKKTAIENLNVQIKAAEDELMKIRELNIKSEAMKDRSLWLEKQSYQLKERLGEYNGKIELLKSELNGISSKDLPIIMSEDDIEQLTNEYNKKVEASNELNKKISEYDVKIKQLYIERDNKLDLIEKVSGTNICPLTGDSCTADLSQYITSQSLLVDKIKYDINAYKTDLDIWVERLNNIDIGKVTEEYWDVIKKHDNDVFEIKRQEESVARINDNINHFSKEISAIEKQISDVTNELASIESIEIIDTTSEEDIYDGLKAQKLSLLEEIEVLKQKAAKYEDQKKAVDMYRESEELELMFKAAKEAVKDFKTRLIEEAVSGLSNYFNKCMLNIGRTDEILFSFEDAQGTDEFKFSLVEDGYVRSALSKGETVLVGLIMLSYFQRDSSIKLAFIDELMLLDDDNIERLVSSDLLDKFDNVIMFSPREVKINGGFRVEYR